MFCLATEAAPARPNEDFVLATTDLAVVVDGGGEAAGDCSHGVPWFARQLGAHVLTALVDEPGLPLAEGLARAVRAVARLHVYSCELSSPRTPRAGIAVIRIGPGTVDVLALGSCVAVVDTDTGPQVTREQAGRATPSWIAADPQAAHRALTAGWPRTGVRRVAVLSDGAARPIDDGRLSGWPEGLDLLDKLGPAAFLSHFRPATAHRLADDPADGSGPDDASVVYAPLR